MAISETWLHKGIYNNDILSCGYNLYRNNRGSKGGGVMLAINDNLNSEQLPAPENIEAIAVSIKCKRVLNFGIVFIPPISPNSYHNSVINFIHSLPLPL